ncbi:uncharacterized protein TNCV_2935361 [Trichonephila clavipes]|nr:uncharacterized protein TNCV_2935361 [Trichonephila clavipes]
MIKNVEFKTPNNEVLQETNLARLYDDMSEKIVKESEDFEGRDSGWTLDEILRLEVRTNRYSPFRGSSSFIEVPKQIAETKAIINVINKKDSQCFMWSILAALYPNTSNPNKTSSYVPHLNKLNFDGISFPTPLNEDILNLSDESDVGYILEVDLEYPSDLHDKHSDFPLAPENKPPPNCKEPRLLTTLEPKTKYVLHYSNLKLYLKLGSKIKANAGEKQLNSSVGTKQLNSALPSTAYNRLQPPAPPAPPLQKNRLFLPTDAHRVNNRIQPKRSEKVEQDLSYYGGSPVGGSTGGGQFHVKLTLIREYGGPPKIKNEVDDWMGLDEWNSWFKSQVRDSNRSQDIVNLNKLKKF